METKTDHEECPGCVVCSPDAKGKEFITRAAEAAKKIVTFTRDNTKSPTEAAMALYMSFIIVADIAGLSPDSFQAVRLHAPGGPPS